MRYTKTLVLFVLCPLTLIGAEANNSITRLDGFASSMSKLGDVQTDASQEGDIEIAVLDGANEFLDPQNIVAFGKDGNGRFNERAGFKRHQHSEPGARRMRGGRYDMNERSESAFNPFSIFSSNGEEFYSYLQTLHQLAKTSSEYEAAISNLPPHFQRLHEYSLEDISSGLLRGPGGPRHHHHFKPRGIDNSTSTQDDAFGE